MLTEQKMHEIATCDPYLLSHRSTRSLGSVRGSGLAEMAGGMAGLLSSSNWESQLAPPTVCAPGPTQFEVTVRDSVFGIIVEGAPPRWLGQLVGALQRVAALPRNWNSYGGHAVEPLAVFRGLQVLVRLLDADSPPPGVHPNPEGGIQFEWHPVGLDLEIEITPRGRVVALVEDASGGNWEADVTQSIERLRPIVRKLPHLELSASE